MPKQTIRVTLITKPGEVNGNGRVYSHALCEKIVDMLNEREVRLYDGTPNDLSTLSLRDILGESVKGTAEFTGNRIEVDIAILNDEKRVALQHMMEKQIAAIGTVLTMSEKYNDEKTVRPEHVESLPIIHVITPVE